MSCLAGSSLEASRAGLSQTSVLSPHTGGHPVKACAATQCTYRQLGCVWGRESHRSSHAVPAAREYFPCKRDGGCLWWRKPASETSQQL